MSDRNEKIIEEFRANNGRVSGYFADKTLLILHTTGAKTGRERIKPLMTFEDEGQLVIVASKGGAPTHPDWYYNLLAHPIVGVEYGTEQFQARAAVTEEPERTRLYQKMEKQAAAFSDYKKKAGRVIPVITLERL